MNDALAHRRSPYSGCQPIALAGAVAIALLSSCAAPAADPPAGDGALEEIYVLRSIREPHTPTAGGCAKDRTGFEPFATDADRFFSFWSVEVRTEDGRVSDAKRARVAELRGCFGSTAEPARQNFHADIQLGVIAFQGRGECLALMADFPETGLFPVRCQLELSGLPAPFVGGLLTTNTLTSAAAFGGETQPAGYAQASIATIRLWRSRSSP
jgi:hypothetical protein